MTTDCLTTYDMQAQRVQAPSRDLLAAAVTAAGFILLLPGAVLLMSFLTA